MAYVAVPNANLAVNKPIRSADITQMNDNITDHEGRLVAVEDASIRVFSHFVGRYGYTVAGPTFTDLIITGGGAEKYYDGGRFFLHTTGDLSHAIAASGTADNHYLRWTPGAAGFGQCMSNLSYNFGSRTKPITFTWRFRASDNTNAFHLGLTNWPAYGTNATPTDGIYLLLGSAANTFRFRSTSSVSGFSTTGADITFTNATWYEVKIVFTDSPGNRALCYIDGLLKETITTDLPTTINLFGRYTMASGAADTFDLDRALVSAAGTLSDVP